MNSKRRAELQRKLSMGAVPRPPADLAERIKADIPQYLHVTEDRGRFTMSLAFSMRIAASVLLLTTTALVTLRVLDRPEESRTTSIAAAARPKLVPAVTRYEPNTATTAQEQPAADEVRLEIAQERISVPTAAAPPPVVTNATPAEPQTANAARKREADGQSAGTLAVTDGAPVVEAPAQSAEVTRRRVDDRPFGRSPSAVIAEAAPAPVAPPSAPVAEALSAPAATSSLVAEAHAADLELKQKPEVFGISVDAGAFDDVKLALQKGTRPSASSVNVDALVNYFAGPPARAPRRVNLEVEASPAPVEAEGDHAVLRFTIDTPRVALRPRESTPPVATDARIEIEIDSKAVANFRRIGTNASLGTESTLLHNLSVTGLYQLELSPGLKGNQRVATVRLRYRSVTDGQTRVIERVVRGSDLARSWTRASRRHRLASLGAVWSESLKGTGTQIEVARRAEELATQAPADTRARDLANVATATAGGGKR